MHATAWKTAVIYGVILPGSGPGRKVRVQWDDSINNLHSISEHGVQTFITDNLRMLQTQATHRICSQTARLQQQEHCQFRISRILSRLNLLPRINLFSRIWPHRYLFCIPSFPDCRLYFCSNFGRGVSPYTNLKERRACLHCFLICCRMSRNVALAHFVAFTKIISLHV